LDASRYRSPFTHPLLLTRRETHRSAPSFIDPPASRRLGHFRSGRKLWRQDSTRSPAARLLGTVLGSARCMSFGPCLTLLLSCHLCLCLVVVLVSPPYHCPLSSTHLCCSASSRTSPESSSRRPILNTTRPLRMPITMCAH